MDERKELNSRCGDFSSDYLLAGNYKLFTFQSHGHFAFIKTSFLLPLSFSCSTSGGLSPSFCAHMNSLRSILNDLDRKINKQKATPWKILTCLWLSLKLHCYYVSKSWVRNKGVRGARLQKTAVALSLKENCTSLGLLLRQRDERGTPFLAFASLSVTYYGFTATGWLISVGLSWLHVLMAQLFTILRRTPQVMMRFWGSVMDGVVAGNPSFRVLQVQEPHLQTFRTTPSLPRPRRSWWAAVIWRSCFKRLRSWRRDWPVLTADWFPRLKRVPNESFILHSCSW